MIRPPKATRRPRSSWIGNVSLLRKRSKYPPLASLSLIHISNSSDQPQRDENNKNKEANPSERNFTAETDADTDASEETTETNKPKMSGDVKGGNTDKTGTDRSAGNSTL